MKTFTIYRAEVVHGRVVVRVVDNVQFDYGAYVSECTVRVREYRPELGWRRTYKAAVSVLLKEYRRAHRIAQKEANRLCDIVSEAEELYYE